MAERNYLSPAEAAVVQALLPPGLTPEMADVAYCLFEALVLADRRAGTPAPDGPWLHALHAMARAVVLQIKHLAAEKGGSTIYLAKGVAVWLSARDRQLCAEFRGDNYAYLARKYDLSEMRVRQIISAWRQEQFLARQGRLPGLDEP